MSAAAAFGPLQGVRVFDLGGLGPAPFATMMMAQFGAHVVSVRRPDPQAFDPAIAMAGGKRSIALDLRTPDGQAVARRLAGAADVLVEGFRPGVMERLGLGPDALHADNPQLIYARLTGWGQTGPYARRAGHDINYLAISGALGVTGEDKPVAPPALLGDLANGSYLVMIGVLMALVDQRRTGRGQVVDAAIVDGAAYMLNAMFGEMALKLWDGDLRHSMLGGCAPFYGAYRCADGRWFSVGAIEGKFYASMLEVLGLSDVDASPGAQLDRAAWPALRARVATAFAARPQSYWTAAFAEAEACGAPVVGLADLPDDPHLMARGTVRRTDDGLHAAPAPRLSAHPDLVSAILAPCDDPVESVLRDAGFTGAEIATLVETGVVRSA